MQLFSPALNMCDIEVLEKLVEDHVGTEIKEKCWKIEKSILEGRGIFTTRDIKPGEVVFIDSPIISGPRAGIATKPHCVICMELSDLKPCSKGCGLPVCSEECEDNLNHLKECDFIQKHGGNFKEISLELFRSLSPMRALFLDEKQQKLLLCLANHVHEKHGFEIGLIKSKISLNEEEEQFLRKICYVFDANAFEVVVDAKDNLEDFSIRGLYPVSALLNHSCVPNTTHLFDKNQRMIVKTTAFIPKGSEILTSYTSLFWATAARRHHLWTTKHFYCNCQRCKDPKEFGSCLGGLKCVNPTICEGVMFPIDPLDHNTKWVCDLCEFKVTRKTISIIQSALGSMLSTTNMVNPNEIIKLLKERIHRVVPLSNQIVAELKCRVVWLLGRKSNSLLNGKKNIHRNLMLCYINFLKKGSSIFLSLIYYQVRSKFFSLHKL